MSRAMTADEVFKGSDIKITDFNDIYQAPKNKAEDSNDMSDSKLSKTELDALLKSNKAEVDAVAAGMREEMAHWREEQNAQMSKVITTLSVLDVKLDERYENQKTSTTRTQWLVGIAIAVAALVPAFIGIFKPDTAQQPQPTVIYVQQPSLQSIEQPSPQK
ncbi:hypothetical protein [Providencia rettgeri]|uniref:hypothetical protein n=1 Tax=Providencia rettgeri TaxID=587 RepID=UPI002551DD00|nr:hypothetical protein [Providencia rettgeri]MDK7746616.1 hypothetical protein [Providencia rettgeri]MDK7759489.1 hypothetical protein [Providencia rettgeri]